MKYYQLETSNRKANIMVFGDITSYPWFESDVSAYNLSKEIQDLDVDEIDVHINSYGGEVAEALAIANTLMRHSAKVTTYVDGFACSAATIIFMAGDERIVSEASCFLVHPASVYTCGNAEDLRREAENLDTITEQSINLYMKGLTKSRDELVELMSEEKFLSPEEVFEWGFATKLESEDEDVVPTQSVRRLVSERLSTGSTITVANGSICATVAPLETQEMQVVRIDEAQMQELRNLVKQEEKQSDPIGPEPANEPEPVEPQKVEEKSFLEKFLNR